LLGFVLRVADSGPHEGDSDDGRECCGFFHLGFWFLVLFGGVSLIACRGENLIFLKKTWRGVRVVLG
jgi:hypothetical protein